MIRQDWSSLKKLLFFQMAAGSGAAIEATATGNPLTFVTDLAKPLRQLKVNFLPIQAAGTPSPDNILPITGLDAVNVFHAGKNLFNFDSTKLTTGVTGNGNARSYYPLGLKGCTIEFSAEPKNAQSLTTTYLNIGKLSNGVLSTLYNFIYPDGITNRAVTFAENEEAVIMGTSDNTSNITQNIPKYNIQVEVGSSATAYEEPVIPTVYPASFPSTIYGGYVDMVTGEVWATYYVDTLDGTRTIYSNGNTSYGAIQAYYTPNPAKKFAEGDNREGLKSDKFQSAQEGVEYYISGRMMNGNIYINMPEGITTKQLAQEWFSENPTQVGYILASPVLITTLTPLQINAIKGNNTIWSDADGQLTATYLKKG